MTYICGYSRGKTNFVVCDTRLTWQKQSAEATFLDVGVKSGVLFPGCIFARAGDTQTSAMFLRQACERVATVSSTTEKWQAFTDFVEEYPFPSGHFRILLSSRAGGTPEFFIVDSKGGLIRNPTEPVGLGSGTSVLKHIVQQELEDYDRLERRIRGETSDKLPSYMSAYRLCQNLTLLAQSWESSFLAQHDVGGVFHFVSQSEVMESRQRPSLFIVTVFSEQTNSIFLWLYRIAPVYGGLAIDTFVPPKQSAGGNPRGEWYRDFYWDLTLTAELDGEMEIHEIGRKLRDRAFQEIEAMEFYHYGGWGFADPTHRQNFGFQVVHKGEKSLVTADGRVHGRLLNQIVEQIQAVIDVRGQVTVYSPNQWLRRELS